MAQDPRGGNRPTAPQNNPANVSGTGGAGQSGRYSGFAYGQNKALAEQMQGAPMAKGGPSAPAPTGGAPMGPQMPQATPVTDPTQNPDEHIMHGAPMGPGANSIPGLPQPSDNSSFNQTMQTYRPVLEFIASRPETSAETRGILSRLMNGIE